MSAFDSPCHVRAVEFRRQSGQSFASLTERCRDGCRIPKKKNPRESGGLARATQALFLEPDAREFFLEPGEPPAAVDQLLLTAGPGRVRSRIDVEVQRVALLAPGAARRELGAVGHYHLDRVIIRMQIG